MESVKLGNNTFLVKPPWHPVRFRLHTAMTEADENQDVFAALCAILGACVPMIDGRSEEEQRRHIRTDPIDYGERVMNILLEQGHEIQKVSEIAVDVAKHVFGLAPTDQEVDDAVDFTKPKVASSTTSTSVRG